MGNTSSQNIVTAKAAKDTRPTNKVVLKPVWALPLHSLISLQKAATDCNVPVELPVKYNQMPTALQLFLAALPKPAPKICSKAQVHVHLQSSYHLPTSCSEPAAL